MEQISLMKPKAQGSQDEGFLEDIIGTNKYIEKIDEDGRKLLFDDGTPCLRFWGLPVSRNQKIFFDAMQIEGFLLPKFI